MAKSLINELEEKLLDQIEKLNDDSICEDKEQAKNLIERSRVMSELTNSYIAIQNTKLDEQKLKIEAVKVMHQTAVGYKDEDSKIEKYLGIEQV